MFEKNMKSAVFFTAVLIFAFVFIFVIEGVEYGAVSPGDPDEEVAEVEEVDEEGEIFTASAEGYGGELTVEVEIADNQIIAVRVTEHSETDGLADPAIEDVPAAIVDSQSTDVDIVSGVTVTSEAIMEAASKALEEAGFDPDAVEDEEPEEEPEEETRVIEGVAEGYGGDLVVEVELDADNKIVAINIIEHNETDDFADEALEEIPAAIIEAQSTDVDIVTGVTETSEAIMAAVANALEDEGIELGEAEDVDEEPEEEAEEETRIVEGIAEGYGGDIVVEVELGPGDEILAINIIEHNETDGFADPAFEEIPDAIIDAQSTDVDIVTGVTETSEAIMEAVKSALE